MKNLFEPIVAEDVCNRIDQLNPDSQPMWGSMSVGQMLAHCNVTYEYVFEPHKYAKPGALKKFFISLFVKRMVVGNKPYKKNSPTAPDFKQTSPKEFNHEKERLVSFVRKVAELGGDYFNGKESHSFGNLTKEEWNTMFYKHLDHHLSQFGV
jgi:hypothetical protein